MSCYSHSAVRRLPDEPAPRTDARPDRGNQSDPATGVRALAPAERAPRCLRLVISKRGKNQCESEQVPGSALCAHHLAQAAEDYRAIVTVHHTPEGVIP